MFARQLKIATGTVYGFSEHMVAGFETEAHVNLTPKFYFLLLTTGSERRFFNIKPLGLNRVTVI